jgi:hypothetical protein
MHSRSLRAWTVLGNDKLNGGAAFGRPPVDDNDRIKMCAVPKKPNRVRLCEGVSEAEEERLRELATTSRDAWFVFTSYFPNGDRAEFLDGVLEGHFRDTKTATDVLAVCLFTQFVRLDREITDDDEERLQRLVGQLRETKAPWPASKDYFDVLEAAVADEWGNDRATIFRIRQLSNRLSDLYIFGK